MVDVEEAKKALNDLANIASQQGFTGAGLVSKIILKQLEVLQVIYDAPFIIEELWKKNDLGKQANERYMWGTISSENAEKVKEFFSDGKI